MRCVKYYFLLSNTENPITINLPGNQTKDLHSVHLPVNNRAIGISLHLVLGP